MATTVEVPIRLRLDAAALLAAEPGLPDVAGAVRAAAGRALRTSAQVVPAASAVLAEPSFVWYGDGLASIGGATRIDVEAAVTGALAAAVADAELTAGTGADGSVGPGTLAAQRAGEPVDERRYAEMLRRYVVDSYDGGQPTDVTVEGGEEDAPSSGSGWAEVVGSPEAHWGDSEWVNAFLASAELAQQGAPRVGVVGLLFSFSGGYAIRYFRVTAMTWDGVTMTDDILPLYRLVTIRLDDRGRPRSVVFHVPARSMPMLRSLGDTITPEARIALKRSWLREQVQARYDTERDRLIAALGADGLAAARRASLEWADRISADPPDIVGYVELQVGEDRFLISMGSQFGWPAGTLIPVVVYNTIQTVSPRRRGRTGGERDEPGEEPGGTGLGESGTGPGGGGKDESGTGGRGGERAGGTPGGTGTAPRGGLFESPGDEEGGFRFPTSAEDGDPLVCTPFLAEPPLSELGEDGDRLRRIIARIAAKLAIPTCEFAGGFALTAAAAIGRRATDVGNFGVSAADAFLQPPPAGGPGNVGPASFEAAPSPAIAFLRHLGGVAPDMTVLVGEIHRTYERPEHRGKIRSFREPISWIWRFHAEVNAAMRHSVAVLFGMTCRILLMQLLRASETSIRGRLAQIDAYTELFEQALLPRLRRIEELTSLRDQLRSAPATPPQRGSPVEALPGGTPLPDAGTGGGSGAPPDAGTGGTGGGGAGTPASAEDAQRAWEAARSDLTDSLRAPDTAPAASSRRGSETGVPPPSGTLTWPATGGPRIYDSAGRTWSIDELEQAIVRNRGLVEEVDPLVKQLVELDEVLRRFDNPALGVRAELQSLLGEMLRNNAEQQAEVTDSWLYAFRASRISEDIPAVTVPGTRYVLGGIHLQAHAAVGDAFRGDTYYGMGIDGLFGSEQGLVGIVAFFEFTGVLLLSIVCPPLGAVVGIALAGYHLHEAHEREELYESLLDPELVATRAEIEAELFAARLGFALSIIPEAGTIVRSGARLGGAVVRTGAHAAARGAVRRIAAHLAEETARSLRRGFVVALLREVAQDQIVEAVAQRVLEPIIADLQREVSVTGPVGGVAGATRTIDRLLAEREVR